MCTSFNIFLLWSHKKSGHTVFILFSSKETKASQFFKTNLTARNTWLIAVSAAGSRFDSRLGWRVSPGWDWTPDHRGPE